MTDEIFLKIEKCEKKLRDLDFEKAGEVISEIKICLCEIKIDVKDEEVLRKIAEIERKINLGVDSLANPQNYEKQIIRTQNLRKFTPFTAEIGQFEPKIKISIIVPVYNGELWIERCFNSIINQNYRKNLIEAIFIDDNSTDNSFAVLRKIVADYEEKFSNREKITFKLFKQPQNFGQGKARNKGLEKSSGDYVFFLDSDDELSENSLDALAYLAQKYKDVDIVQGNYEIIKNEGNLDKSTQFIYTMNNRIMPEYTDCALWIRQRFPFYFNILDRIDWELWAKLIRKNFIVENNLYQGDFLTGQDMHFCFLASKKIGSMAFTKAKTYVYHEEHLSVTLKKNNDSKLFALLDLYNEMLSHMDWEVVLIYINHIKTRIARFDSFEVRKRVKETNKRIENGLASIVEKYIHGESNPGCRDENPES